ncbi:MAG: c-type cytochrome [Acidobacteriaceae bacterium]|nr:c-type cytochrome [Acidobacteriaceae bacterium]
MNAETKRPSMAAFLAASFVVMVSLIAFSALNSAAQSGPGSVPETDRGKQLFDRRCGGCHSLDQDQTGPHLRNVYGRKVGSVPGFKYSAAVNSASFTWDDTTLDKWLTDPESLIPGNEMDFSVPKAEERAAIIRFLRLSSGK